MAPKIFYCIEFISEHAIYKKKTIISSCIQFLSTLECRYFILKKKLVYNEMLWKLFNIKDYVLIGLSMMIKTKLEKIASTTHPKLHSHVPCPGSTFP